MCLCVFQTVDVSIPAAGSTMEPEQRGASHRLSAPDGFAAELNESVGSKVHKVKDATSTFI